MKGSEEQDVMLVRQRLQVIWCATLIGRPAGGSSIYDAAVRRMTRHFLSARILINLLNGVDELTRRTVSAIDGERSWK